MTDFTWTFQFNDLTVMGFLAFGLYLFVGIVCCLCAFMLRDQLRRGSMWLLTGAFLAVMGINKQFDLHNLVRDIGRIVAEDQGWYDSRRAIQRTVILVLIVAGLMVMLFLIGLYWRYLIDHQVLLIGLFVLVGVIIFQASAFHHFNPLGFLVEYQIFDVVELLALGLIGLDAVVYLRELWQLEPPKAYVRNPQYDSYSYNNSVNSNQRNRRTVYEDEMEDIESTMIMPSPYPDQPPRHPRNTRKQ